MFEVVGSGLGAPVDILRDKLQAEQATVHVEADGYRVLVDVQAPDEPAARAVVESVLLHKVERSVGGHFASVTGRLRIHSR